MKLEARDRAIQREIAIVCRAALCERILGHGGSALRVAVMVVMLLHGFKERKAKKTYRLWIRFLQELDQQAGENPAYWSAFGHRMVSGESVIDMLVWKPIEVLLTLEGPWKHTLGQWRGPIKASYLPSSAFQTAKSPCVWTFSQYQYSENRYYWHTLQLLLLAIIVPMSTQLNFDAVKKHLIDVNSGLNTQLPLNWLDVLLLLGVIMSLSEGAYALQLYLGVCVLERRLQPVEGGLLVSIALAAIASVYLAYSSWCPLSFGLPQMVNLQYSVSFWVIAMVAQAIYCTLYSALRVTQSFGLITNSMIATFKQVVPFLLLLLLITYAYASQYSILYIYLAGPWTKTVLHSMYYAFTQVLGSVELDEPEFSESLPGTCIKVLFVFMTYVILLNFLVSILSKVYVQSRKMQRRDRLLLMHWYGKEKLVRCAIPPFSILSHFIWVLAYFFPKSMCKCVRIVEKVAYSFTFFPVGLCLKVIVDCICLFPMYIREFAVRSRPRSHIPPSNEEKGTVTVVLHQPCKREMVLWALFGLFLLLLTMIEDWVHYIQLAYRDPILLSPDRLDTSAEELIHISNCEEPQSPQQENKPVCSYMHCKPEGLSAVEFTQQIRADYALACQYPVGELIERARMMDVAEMVEELEREMARLEEL